MIKTFTAGLAGILFSATLGIFAATSAVNATISVEAPTPAPFAQFID